MNKVIVCDIDGTICTTTKNGDYKKAKPFIDRIQKMNKLYYSGWKIIYHTARGSHTGKDWKELTKKQFEKWGVKYSKLKFGKIEAECFIDDKGINDKNFFK